MISVKHIREFLTKTHVLIEQKGKRRLFYIPATRQFYATEIKRTKEIVEFETTKVTNAVKFWNEWNEKKQPSNTHKMLEILRKP